MINFAQTRLGQGAMLLLSEPIESVDNEYFTVIYARSDGRLHANLGVPGVDAVAHAGRRVCGLVV